MYKYINTSNILCCISTNNTCRDSMFTENDTRGLDTPEPNAYYSHLTIL